MESVDAYGTEQNEPLLGVLWKVLNHRRGTYVREQRSLERR